MERLSGLDASFLYLETPTLHMHVSMAAVFDPSTIKGGYSFERVRELVTRRLVKVPVFGRRLVMVPFRLGHPYWVDDPAFDIDFHLRRAALPAPGGVDELAEFVGDFSSRQLDRSKPLWQMYIVEGLENGNIALVTKMHHSTIDGVSGAELLAQLFDLSSDPLDTLAEPVVRRARIPSDVQIVAQALATRLTKPPRIARLMWKTAFALLDVRKVRSSEGAGKAALPLTAPRTSMNAAITAHRKVAFSSISLDDVKRLKNFAGTTVNDVVLAVCTGALRSYLQSREELPESPLVATVPVAVQDMKGRQGSNHVSAMFVSLPTHIEDPLERLETINKGTKGAKEEHNALGAEVLLDWVEHATPTVFGAAARTYSRLKLADRHRPIHNLIISNVPGPDFPLYFSGAEMVAGFPLGPVLEGAGLNITVMSYRGVLNWGLMACRETVAGAGEIADSIPAALDELLVAAGLGRAVSVGIAPGPNLEQPDSSRAVSIRTEAPDTTSEVKPASQDKTSDKKSGQKKSGQKKTAEKTRAAKKSPPKVESANSTAAAEETIATDPVETLIGEDSPAAHEESASVEVVIAGSVAATEPTTETEQPVAEAETFGDVEPVENSPITRRASESELIAELLDPPAPVNVHSGAGAGSSEAAQSHTMESSNGSGITPA